MKTPDEEVAERIVAEFRRAGLLSENGLRKLLPALAAGKMKVEDWKLAFEIDRPEAEEPNARQNQ